MNTALLIVNFALVLVTGGLVYITYQYMLHTKRMADVMVREYELKVSPLIELELLGSSTGEIKLSLSNIGLLPVDINKIVFEWWHNSKSDRLHYKEYKIDPPEKLFPNKTVTKKIEYYKDDFVTKDFSQGKAKLDEDSVELIYGRIYANYTDKDGTLRKTNEVSQSLRLHK